MSIFARTSPARGPGVMSKIRQFGTFAKSNRVGPGEVSMLGGQRTVYGTLPYWVPDVWEFYDKVGEAHHNARFLAGAMSRCTLRVGVLDENNRIGPAFDDKGKPIEGVDPALVRLSAKLIASLRAMPLPGEFTGPVGGQGVLLSRIGANLGMVAECFVLCQEKDGETPNPRRAWEVVSAMEVQPMEGKPGEKQKFRRRRTRMMQFEEVTPDFYLRIYRSHPAYSGEPDSSNRSLLSVLERLALLDDEGIADSRSRLAGNGVYWVPSEIDFPGDEDNPDNEFLTDRFIEIASTALSDPRAPARFVPLVGRGPAELLEHIRHDKFDHDNTAVLQKRQGAVGDFARGSEFPPEVTVGFGETTFANAFAVTEEISRMRVEPWLDDVCGCFTGGYLWPSLMKYRKLDPEDIPPSEIARIQVWYDVSNLVSHANPEKIANAGYGSAANPNNLIGAKGWRRLMGIPEAEAPSEEEWKKRIKDAHDLRQRSEVGGKGDPNSEDPAPADGGVPEDGTDTDEEIGKRVMAIGNHVVRRSVERAGATLRAKAANRPELVARINGVDNADVARVLGPQEVAKLGTVTKAIAGDLSSFERTVLELCADAGRPDAADLAAAAVRMVAAVIAARLYNPMARLDATTSREFVGLLIRDA